MRPVQGDVQPNKLTVDFDKIGHIDKKRTNVYKMPVHERNTLKFALKGVRANKVELFADGILLSVIKPTYESDWTPDVITHLDFFGGKNFHRGLIEVPVEVVVTTEEEEMPSIMVGVVTPSKKWADIADEYYHDQVTAKSEDGEKRMILTYHHYGCGYTAEVK